MKPNLYYATIKRQRTTRNKWMVLTSFGLFVLNLILFGAVAVAYLVWLPPVR